MDRLEELLSLQQECDNKHQKKLLEKPLDEQILGLSRAIIHEAVELQRELPNTKWWKDVKYDEAKVKEESIDILFFLLSLMNKVFKNSEEVFTEYHKKFLKNMHREDFLANKDVDKIKEEINREDV